MDFFAPLIAADSIDSLERLNFARNDLILPRDTLYFDWMASALDSRSIRARLEKILPFYANTHSHNSRHSDLISDLYAESKQKIRESLGLGEDFLIIPSGFGATGAMKKFQEIMGIYAPPRLKERLGLGANRLESSGESRAQLGGESSRESSPKNPLPLVIVGPFEHHSNEISLREGLCECVRVPLKGANIDVAALKSILDSHKNREIIASLNVASNVTGALLPLDSIIPLLRESRATIALDFAAIAAHKNVDSSLFDAAFISPHKLFGGAGSCGILAIRKNLLNCALPPTFGGGGSIRYASRDSHFFVEDLEAREEAGTPPILGLLKAALAFKYRNEMGLEFALRREKILGEILRDELRQIAGLELYGAADSPRIGVFSFNVAGVSPYDLSAELSYKHGIETRSGCSCAGPYGHDLLQKPPLRDIAQLEAEPSLKPAWLRVSLHYSHNFLDIERFITALKKSIKALRK